MIFVLPTECSILEKYMASIIKKIKNGNTYYYAAESKRVDGRPRIVWQKYLGTLDTILKNNEGKNDLQVKETDIFEAGGVAAMLNIANKIGIAKIIDEVVPKRNQGPSIGEYLLLASINRILKPCSKLQMSDWYKETVLRRLWTHSPETFSSRNFWSNMDLVKEEYLEEIQEKIAQRVIDLYKINPTTILYDTTNFFTYIATGNNRNTIAKRGKNKQKRNDLRQVGLALMVTKDFHIPLFHKIYDGNLADRGEFAQKAKEIKTWKNNCLETQSETTLVFDKGNVSEQAIEQLIATNQHFICAIPKSVAPKIFKTTIDKFNFVNTISGTKAYCFKLELWSKNFKAILAYSESYFTASLNELNTRLQKCQKQLSELDKKLEAWKNTEGKNRRYFPTKKRIEASANSIITGPYMKKLVKFTIKKIDGLLRINYHIDRNEFQRIVEEELGRTLIISTRRNWKKDVIIKEYRGLNTIEGAFRNMKHSDYLHWQPAFHWTDQKIKVHGLYCVIALLLSSLAHKTVQEAGVDISLPGMLNELSKIREVALIYTDGSRKKNILSISRMTGKQKKISNALEIAEVLKG